LKNQEGKSVEVADLLGSYSVLYFYPKVCFETI